MMTMMTFGERLREIRLQRGMTQKELGRLSGLTESWICHFESGHRLPRFENFQSLCRGLGVRLSVFEDCLPRREG